MRNEDIKELIENMQVKCPADSETFEKHVKILNNIETVLPKLDKTLDKIQARLDKHGDDILILKTERRILLWLAPLLGGASGFISKYL